jgi:hypothetical protein
MGVSLLNFGPKLSHHAQRKRFKNRQLARTSERVKFQTRFQTPENIRAPECRLRRGVA